ncbi:MAG: hypothetical protein FWH35_08065 [Treponema sp.]|nr:hypothetical protein [Treponema sp.]
MTRYISCFILIVLLIVSCGNKVIKETIKIDNNIDERIEINETKDANPIASILDSESNLISNRYNEINDPKDVFVNKNPYYTGYEYIFEPLKSDEILSYSYGKYVNNDEEYKFLISAKDTVTEEERILGYWNVSYGDFQISNNRKSGIFILNTNIKSNRNNPLLRIDGKIGVVKYLFGTNSSAMSNFDLTCLLYRYDNKGLFVLVDLEKNDYIRSIEWNKSNEKWGGGGIYRIFRSLDPNYDFRIDYYQDHYILAIAYYNVERDQLETVFDISDYDISYNFTKEREKILPEELGY